MKNTLVIVLMSALAVACGNASSGQSRETEEPSGQQALANPASTYCVEQGGTLVIKEGQGGQFGVCAFDDGSFCEEWQFKRGACKKGACRQADGQCQ